VSSCTRLHLPVAKPELHANIRRRYPIEAAAWIWDPRKRKDEVAALVFENRFRVMRRVDLVFYVSADQRYELSLDGQLVSLGPDRSDLAHWSFASYRVSLKPGMHRFEAIAWWIGGHAPSVQMTWQPGFIFAAEGQLASQLNTGCGRWRVRSAGRWTFGKRPGEVGTFSVGAYQTIEGPDPEASSWTKPLVVTGPLEDSPWCALRSGWQLEPSPLPDQVAREFCQGRVLAVIDGSHSPERPLQCKDFHHPSLPKWQCFLDGKGPLMVPARTTVSVLWDLQEYFCAYSQAVLRKGRGAEVSFIWAESPFERPASNWSKHKGLRRELVGKYYRGLRDTFASQGGPRRPYRACWWRSGRYILLDIRTADEPLILEQVSLRETRYPLESESRFACDDPGICKPLPMMLRGLQMNAHETFMDCPHYEQTLYPADGRLELLTNYALTRDDRLARHCIRLFDWSRCYNGFVNAGYPSGPQIISTFPFYWVMMVHDYALWRDDPEFVAERMAGVRGTLEGYRRMLNEDGLVHPFPGWPFIDTVPEWDADIYGPDPKKGPWAIANLLYAYALVLAADLEDLQHEPELASRNRRQAQQVAKAVLSQCWSTRRNLVADYPSRRCFSEHAQCMALLSGLLPASRRKACFQAMLAAKDLYRAQPTHWMFYLFEVYQCFGRGDLILQNLGTWNEWLAQGLLTPPEMYEPSRSDCHGWGAHPLFHLRASVAGIRPASPGFRTVEIAPHPGHLTNLEASMAHPRGMIETQMSFSGTRCEARVHLPKGVRGVFRWRKRQRSLQSGWQRIAIR
jgi:hypothetical protein